MCSRWHQLQLFKARLTDFDTGALRQVINSGVGLREPGGCLCGEDRVARVASPMEALVTPLDF